MATKDLNDIDAQIKALMEKKKEIIAKEKEKEKKETEARQKAIGAAVEKVLGKVTDITSFKEALLKVKGEFQIEEAREAIVEGKDQEEKAVVNFA